MFKNKANKVKHSIENEINTILEIEKQENACFSIDGDYGIIKLHLERDNLYKNYSNKTLLDEEIFDFIFESFKFIRKKKKIKLIISYAKDITFEEKEKIKNLIKKYYAIKYKETKDEIRRSKTISFICLIIGIAILITQILLMHFLKNNILNEVINIFSWVFIWEACDIYAFTITKYNISLIQSLRLFEMDIVDSND